MHIAPDLRVKEHLYIKSCHGSTVAQGTAGTANQRAVSLFIPICMTELSLLSIKQTAQYVQADISEIIPQTNTNLKYMSRFGPLW